MLRRRDSHHHPKERKKTMQTKKFQGIVILKDGKNPRPVIETTSRGQAEFILKAQYPDARAVFVNEIR